MSFEMFVLTIREDRDDGFERAIVEIAFAPYVKGGTTDGYWNLQDAQGNPRFVTITVGDGPKISNFAINRPPTYESFPEFWAALYEVLRQTCTVLVWRAEGQSCCTANPEFMRELASSDFFADLAPILVSSGAEIDAAIAAS
jgi:hypothetical protein